MLGADHSSPVAALLAGDFYTVPALDKRGGTGDVTDVWRAFGECFAWVAGNHDLFGDRNIWRPSFVPPLYYLDGETIEVDGIKSCLIIRGYKHWHSPFAQLSCGLQILNVEARVVILTE